MARFLLRHIKRNLAGVSAWTSFLAMTTDKELQRALWLSVQSLEAQGRTAEALEQLGSLLVQIENDLPAIDQVAGHMRARRYPLDHVLAAYDKFLESHPDSAIGYFNYAYNLARAARFDAAIESYECALELNIDAPEEVHLNIANIYMDYLHDHDEARSHLQRALAFNPSYSSAFYNLGNLAEQEGDRDGARDNFETCLKFDPENESALARLADTRKFTEPNDPLLSRLAAKAVSSTNADLHFAIGRAYEQLREFDSAWKHFDKGNALDSRLMPAYEPERAEAWFDRIARQCGREWLSQFEGSSAECIFICGMFRSGSTLLEQMLASHPGFTAGGEREFFPRLIAREFPDYPRGLDQAEPGALRDWREEYSRQSDALFGTKTRLTDKRPDNFLYIGLIKAVLPSAKFVVTERDWHDIATSIYSVRLGPSQTYATSLENIRHYIGLQTRLIDHWADVLGPDLRRVSYEDIVLRPQETMTDLLEWLGESWDEQCLAFHEMKNSVKTASVWQVREPLHAKSVGRWKHYRQQFIDALGDKLGED